MSARRPPQALDRRAASLRHEFDRGFAAPPAGEAEPSLDCLAVRAGDGAFLLPLADVVCLAIDKPITPLPGDRVGLLGIAGFRGAILPVYDLAALLGRRRAAGADPGRWLLLVGGAAEHDQVALAFDELDGHLRLPRSALAELPAERRSEPHLRAVVRLELGALPMIDAASILTRLAEER